MMSVKSALMRQSCTNKKYRLTFCNYFMLHRRISWSYEWQCLSLFRKVSLICSASHTKKRQLVMHTLKMADKISQIYQIMFGIDRWIIAIIRNKFSLSFLVCVCVSEHWRLSEVTEQEQCRRDMRAALHCHNSMRWFDLQ